MQKAVTAADLVADAGIGRSPPNQVAAEHATMAILLALSASHLMNDTMQSLIAALYPMLKDKFTLDFVQIGLITLAFQLTASILQPLVGLYSDKRPMPFSLAIGMGATLLGLLLLSVAGSFAAVLCGRRAGGRRFVHLPPGILARRPHGLGRALRLCAGAVPGRRQHRLGDRAAAGGLYRVAARPGQRRLVLAGGAGRHRCAVQCRTLVCRQHAPETAEARRAVAGVVALSPARVTSAICILMALMFSKFVYLASLSTYFTFYLIHKFAVSVQHAQLFLFVFLAAGAVGTFWAGRSATGSGANI